MPRRAVRIDTELDQKIHNATKAGGYRTQSAFIRAAIVSAVRSEDKLTGLEEQTAASFDRVSKELRRVLRGQQALFAMVDALTKAFLTCVPEPPTEAKAQSIAVARERYTRLLKTAGAAMGNGSRSAMEGLVENADE